MTTHFAQRGRRAASPRSLLAVGLLLLAARSAAAADPEPNSDPTFGSAALKAGFMPDPYKRDVTAGGVLVTKLGGVSAHVSKAPEFRLEYTAGSGPLVFEVESKGETALLVRTPDGKWVANGDGLRGQIAFENPATGRYDVYVGSVGPDSIPATLIISGQPRPALVGKGNLPDCYFLGVGVDFFVEQNKLRGCRNDARDLTAAFRRQEGTVYRKVAHEILLGEAARRKSILFAFQKFADRGFPGDAFILSLSGHGGVDGSYWFFTPYDFLSFNQNDTALVDDQLLSASAKLMTQGKTAVLVLDACHSGKMIANARRYFERNNDALKSGGLIIFAACGAEQEATNAGENGVLTKALTEALTPLGDLDRDGRITLGEVRKYVVRRTQELLLKTKHKQNCEVALFGTAKEDSVLAVTKTIEPAARKFEPPKLPKRFGTPKWDASGLEARFVIVSGRIDPDTPSDLLFTLDLREDLPQELKYHLVLIDEDGVKTRIPGTGFPATGNKGGRVVLRFPFAIDPVRYPDAWRTAVTVEFTLE